METTNTIKGIEVIAYKGMNSDMTCRDFQYEVGKSYKTDKVELCNCGFHACLNPRDVLYYYYYQESSRYFKVKLFGKITKCGFDDTKIVATEITILEEINIDKIINNTEWWKNENVIDLLYFSDGLARVRRKDKWNFIDRQGKFLSEQWFDWAFEFNDGLARVRRKDKWNFIDKQGKYLYDKWFNYLGDFKDGFAIVKNEDNLYNLIDRQGKFLSKKWFEKAFEFNDGLARVRRTNGECAKIDKYGNLIKN